METAIPGLPLYETGFLVRPNRNRIFFALAGIPGVLIQGWLDLQGPPKTAFELSRAWQGSELVLLENAGHSTGDNGMGEAIVKAVNRFAKVA